jgi:hypothetical protein
MILLSCCLGSQVRLQALDAVKAAHEAGKHPPLDLVAARVTDSERKAVTRVLKADLVELILAHGPVDDLVAGVAAALGRWTEEAAGQRKGLKVVEALLAVLAGPLRPFLAAHSEQAARFVVLVLPLLPRAGAHAEASDKSKALWTAVKRRAVEAAAALPHPLFAKGFQAIDGDADDETLEQAVLNALGKGLVSYGAEDGERCASLFAEAVSSASARPMMLATLRHAFNSQVCPLCSDHIVRSRLPELTAWYVVRCRLRPRRGRAALASWPLACSRRCSSTCPRWGRRMVQAWSTEPWSS